MVDQPHSIIINWNNYLLINILTVKSSDITQDNNKRI